MSAEHIDALVCGYPSPERERRPLVIIQGHYDDSGSDPQSPVYMLAGVISSAERWKRFSDEWRSTLDADPSIEYLKMSEAHSLKGQFQGWPGPLRDQKVLLLAEVIERHALIFIESSLGRVVYDQYVKDPSNIALKMFNDPYFICFYHLVISVADLHRSFFQVDAEFVFDEHGSIGQRAIDWWQIAKGTLEPSLRKCLASPPSFKNDRKVLPLQAADLYAWHARNAFLPEGDRSIRTSAVMNVLKSVQRKTVAIPPEALVALSESFDAITDFYRGMAGLLNANRNLASGVDPDALLKMAIEIGMKKIDDAGV